MPENHTLLGSYFRDQTAGPITANRWSGTFDGATTMLAFTFRESNLAAIIHAPGIQGAVILALEIDLPVDVAGSGGQTIQTQESSCSKASPAAAARPRKWIFVASPNSQVAREPLG